MPLVRAEKDADFVVEVADEVRTSCTRMNEHVSAMIEEYLQRRTAEIRQEMQQQCDVQLEQMRQTLASAETARSAAEERCVSTKRRLGEAAELLHSGGTRQRVLSLFWGWRCAAEQRSARRRRMEACLQRRECLKAFQCYSLWRLFAAARRGARLEAAAVHAVECREQELLGKLGQYEERLCEEQEKNATLSEDLKEAFVRGMCALNREAVQVLHGSDKSPENDVEAIADILSREGPSRRQSTVHARVEDLLQSGVEQSSICPVHQVDSSGHFYHRCFAPGYCHYSDHRPRSPQLPASNTSSTPPAPLVVRADPQSVRTFTADSAISVRPSARSPQARWKL